MGLYLFNSRRSCSWDCFFLVHNSFWYCSLDLRLLVITMTVLHVNLHVLLAPILFAANSAWKLPLLFQTPLADVLVWIQGSLCTVEISTAKTFERQDIVFRRGFQKLTLLHSARILFFVSNCRCLCCRRDANFFSLPASKSFDQTWFRTLLRSILAGARRNVPLPSSPHYFMSPGITLALCWQNLDALLSKIHSSNFEPQTAMWQCTLSLGTAWQVCIDDLLQLIGVWSRIVDAYSWTMYSANEEQRRSHVPCTAGPHWILTLHKNNANSTIFTNVFPREREQIKTKTANSTICRKYKIRDCQLGKPSRD